MVHVGFVHGCLFIRCAPPPAFKRDCDMLLQGAIASRTESEKSLHMSQSLIFPPRGQRGTDSGHQQKSDADQSSEARRSDQDGAPAADQSMADAARLRLDEAKMRNALDGLGGSFRPQHASPVVERRPTSTSPGHTRRHRFVQDGEVPVTVLRGRSEAPDALHQQAASAINRLDALQHALNDEQAARERVERSLEEAQAVIRDLRTKLAHMELARDEAAAAVRARQALAAAVVEQTPPSAPRVPVAEIEVRVPRLAKATVAERAVPEPTVAAQALPLSPVQPARTPQVLPRPVAPKRAARAAAVEPQEEPQPVKWWLKSKATKKAPTAGKRGPARKPR